ncbi:GDSL-type esterase/lipase family protein [Lapidilactobacillus bayanensis]|uniref:GDSL-type esterase/lipase family protein n=1 Tax=Lapidilactobacillus bayanensis TaxID=2485998 RepID=UPI000F7AA09F|nr:GDSL-type esterase/lipase family protein [Lapidilactobacillus bayanensis]
MYKDRFRKVWSYQPVDYRTWPSLSAPQTQIITRRAGLESSAIKFYFTNQNGVSELDLVDLQLKVIRNNCNVYEHAITFGGSNELALNIDQKIISDEIDYEFKEDDLLQISLTLPKTTYLTSGVVTYSLLDLKVENWSIEQNKKLNQIDYCKMVQDNSRMTYFFGLYGIAMTNTQDMQSVAVFGDSITQQGFFVNHLREELQRKNPNQYFVNNCGIGGNRVLFDTDPMMDKWYRHGIAGIKRFETDVYGESDPNIVFVFHGINDLIQETAHPGEVEDVGEVIEGLTKYAEIIKQHASKSVIATLLPLKKSRFYSDSVENKRQLLNKWIRTQDVYDQVADLELAVVDKGDSKLLDKKSDSGDGLHPNDFGGQQLAMVAYQSIIGL